MTRLRAMLLFVGVIATASGVTYQLALLKPQFTVADVVDAGILQVTRRARLSCRVRIKEGVCRQLPDGGLRPRYTRVGVAARVFPQDAGTAAAGFRGDDDRIIAFDLPNAWHACLAFAGTATDSCDVLEDGACTVPAVCSAGAAPQEEEPLCACRRDAGAGVCLLIDGGAPKAGVTIRAGHWRTDGGGCFRKYCGPEIAGDSTSWPPECPER